VTTSTRALAIAVALAAVTIGAMQTIGPTALGLPPVAAGWLGVIGAVAASAQAFLPAVHQRALRRGGWQRAWLAFRGLHG